MPAVTRVVISVSRAFCSTDHEKRETALSLSALEWIAKSKFAILGVSHRLDNFLLRQTFLSL